MVSPDSHGMDLYKWVHVVKQQKGTMGYVGIKKKITNARHKLDKVTLFIHASWMRKWL